MSVIAGVKPVALEAAIKAYRARVVAGLAPPETVSVTLARDQGFLNTGSVGSGHRVVIDEPRDFGGTGSAADPAELLLAAVGASLSVTLTAHAALRALSVDDIAITLSAWMDAAAFFDPRVAETRGLIDTRIAVMLRSTASRSDLEALLDDAVHASPVVASLSCAPEIVLSVTRP